jgi:hypothetical protein
VLNLKKVFISFPSITLFKRYIDSFNLSTSKEKTIMIINIFFSKNISELEI